MVHVKQVVTGDIKENCYLIYNETSLLIVDPGNDALHIQEEITFTGATPVGILITHTHYDHIGALEEIRTHYNIPVYVSDIEQSWLSDPSLNLSGLARHDDMADVVCQPAEYILTPYETYTLGDLSFKVVPTPGHSPGSLSFIFDGFVVTGDALFSGSIGRSDLPFGDMPTLLHSVRTELFTLPENYIAYPGHGPATTIQKEIRTNPFFN